MANRKLESMKRQRGQALILVLIALALGSLLITPTLNYVYTGLRETHVSQEQLLEQYAADAAVEYSLWQLKYNVDGLTDQLSPENPSATTTITVNGIEVPVTTEITQFTAGGGLAISGAANYIWYSSGHSSGNTTALLVRRWADSLL